MVNTKDQSNTCMGKMMLKGSKETLMVLIVIHITQVKGSKVVFMDFMQHCIESYVTQVTHVKGVKSVLYI